MGEGRGVALQEGWTDVRERKGYVLAGALIGRGDESLEQSIEARVPDPLEDVGDRPPGHGGIRGCQRPYQLLHCAAPERDQGVCRCFASVRHPEVPDQVGVHHVPPGSRPVPDASSCRGLTLAVRPSRISP